MKRGYSSGIKEMTPSEIIDIYGSILTHDELQQLRDLEIIQGLKEPNAISIFTKTKNRTMKTARDILYNYTPDNSDVVNTTYATNEVIEAMKEYATQVAKQALQDAANDNYHDKHNNLFVNDKESILNTEIKLP